MSRKLVHLSDIHFGRIDPALIHPLIAAVREIGPDVVVVSGDLTQRARSIEFQQARAFLDQLPSPQIVVPGNHDVPLYNLYGRFVRRLSNYQRYIGSDLEPSFIDGEIAVLGINTARSLTWKGGRISNPQIARVRERLCGLAGCVTKVVVTHHPFDLPESYGGGDLVGRARMAMEKLAECGADLLLAGHMHLSYVGSTIRRYRIHGHSALVVQAGTATSTRGRGEHNSFNGIRIEAGIIHVDRWTWQPEAAAFYCAYKEQYSKTPSGWCSVVSR